MSGSRVAIVTLGCGRNEADSAQVGGALQAAGHLLVEDPGEADCILVNTCTFIEAAREDSVETILQACEERGGRRPEVLVIGCMAERYRDELAAELPEVAGVHGFGDYTRLPQLVTAAVAGGAAASAPVSVPLAPPNTGFPVRTVPRGPWAYLKIAGGCDRRCTFCTIPSYRGQFASRSLAEIEAEARWLVDQGVRELVCVSENTTSYGKDTPAGRAAQVDLIRAFERIDGLERVRLVYLQPAELTDALLDAMAASPVVAGYYDLSLQHASGPVLHAMARSGDPERFLGIIEGIRARDPHAVFRSSFIVGFPGETAADVDTLEAFITAAGIDWPGFFTYSREDGTPAAAMPDQVSSEEARARREHLVAIAELVADDRAQRFVGRDVRVVVEGTDDGDVVGRSYREGPETDGEVRLPGTHALPGDLVDCRVVATDGVDLVARPVRAGGRV